MAYFGCGMATSRTEHRRMPEVAETTTLPHNLRSGKRVLVIASYTRSLVVFRLELLRAIRSYGHEVFVLAPERDEPVLAALEDIGVTFVQLPMARAGRNVLQDVETFLALRSIIRRLKPDVVLAYTMKPIIYGCLAARLAGIADRYALVTGLGYSFSDRGPSTIRTAVRVISVLLCRLALKGARRVFVYNDADRADLIRHRLVETETVLRAVPGSGVDLEMFRQSEPPRGDPVFLLIARLIRDKGIVEFVEAARKVRKRFPNARWRILGAYDPSPAAISPDEVEAWVEEGTVEYLGETRDVRPFLEACSVLVLPTYYREGIPRSILEALATGRPVITTDAPGCRETVVPGVNGWLVGPRDVESLAEAMTRFASRPELISIMGRASRELAEARFDVHDINRLLLQEMELDGVAVPT